MLVPARLVLVAEPRFCYAFTLPAVRRGIRGGLL